MALFVCKNCGFEKEGRCKPRKCPQCEGKEFEKKAESK
ncbi:MAG: RCKP-type rubredoxin-like domain-containing protein [Bacillota bacterium]|jgi:rubrerythrin